MKSRLLNRRTILKGLGVALALPPLESLMGEHVKFVPSARAAGAPIKRVLIFHFPNGVDFPRWTPPNVATAPVNGSVPLQADTSPVLKVLKDRGLDQDVLLLSGLSNNQVGQDSTGKDGYYSGHEWCAPTLLTGAPPITQNLGTTGSTGVSVDQVIAQKLKGTGSILDSISIAPRYHSFGADKLIHVLSYDQNGRPIDPYLHPTDVFNKFFLSAVDPVAFERIRQSRTGMLDYLRDSIQSVKNKASSNDLRVLEQHLSTINTLSQKPLGTVMAGQCQIGVDWQNQSKNAPVLQNKNYTDSDLKSWCDVMFPMVVSAMQCNLVPVSTISLLHSGEQDLYWPGLANKSDHDISHLSPVAGESCSDPNKSYCYGSGPAQDRLKATSMWKIDRFCDVLSLLKSSNMLADTAIVCFSEFSSGPDHHAGDLPVLVAGGGIQGGKAMRYTCPTAHDGISSNPLILNDANRCSGTGYTPLANLWLTIARAAGVDASALPKLGNSTGTLSGLWV